MIEATPPPPRWKKRLFGTLAALLIVHFIVEVTGHHYLYTTLQRTVFRGSLSPDIREYRHSVNAIIEAGTPQPWPQSTRYGSTELSAEDDRYHQQNKSVSFLVIHRDSVLFENHWDDFGPDTLSNSFSMAKSIVGLLTGIALDKGHISDIDRPIYFYLPEYNYEPAKAITTRHLLSMSSGIGFNEDYLNPFAFPARANYGDNLELLIEEYEADDEPGKTFDYQSGTTQVLAKLIRTTTRTPLAEYASEHVWKKIGAEHDAFWSMDRKDGIEKAFCCINATARDFARIGKLYKNHGRWNGEQIVDSAFVLASIHPTGTLNEDGTPCTTYGYQWWMGEDNGTEFFFMRGILGQYVLVVPDMDLIVVRIGHKRDFGTNERPHPDDVYNYLQMGFKLAGY